MEVAILQGQRRQCSDDWKKRLQPKEGHPPRREEKDEEKVRCEQSSVVHIHQLFAKRPSRGTSFSNNAVSSARLNRAGDNGSPCLTTCPVCLIGVLPTIPPWLPENPCSTLYSAGLYDRHCQRPYKDRVQGSPTPYVASMHLPGIFVVWEYYMLHRQGAGILPD